MALYYYQKDYRTHHPVQDNLKRSIAILKAEVVFLVFILCLHLFFDMIFIVPKNTTLAHTVSPIVEEAVLGEDTTLLPIIKTISPTIIPQPTNSPTPTIASNPTPTPSPVLTTKKKSYKIAVIGDSMVDTMGERLEYLERSLKRKYPLTEFTLYNYGRGAENIEMGLARLNSRFDYQDRHYPTLTEVAPDIIVVGSFAYNPFSPYDRDRHWLSLTKMIEEVKKISPNIYLLAEIAPLRSDFGKGPGGVNYDTDTAFVHSGHIIEQLENAIGLARTLNVPLINTYSASGGRREYVNPHDGIHPSVSGHEFTAEMITNKIDFN